MGWHPVLCTAGLDLTLAGMGGSMARRLKDRVQRLGEEVPLHTVTPEARKKWPLMSHQRPEL